MRDLFNNMGEFSVDVFEKASSIDHLIKLKAEADEAILEPNDITEYSDCLLALFAAAYKSGFSFEDLEKSTENKFEVLKVRKWKILEDGTSSNIYQHIE